MINRLCFFLFLHSAAFAGAVAHPVALIPPSQFVVGVPQVLPQSVMDRYPLILNQVTAVVSNMSKSGPVYAVSAEHGVAVIPQRATRQAKGVFVPFKNFDSFSPQKPDVITIAMTGKAAGELRSQLKSGDSLAARAALDGYFDNAFEKARALKDSVDWSRSFFEMRTLLDLEDIRGTVVTKARKMAALPKSVRAELKKGKDRVVYSVVLDGYKSFAVFNSKPNWGARGTLFGPKGERLGRVRTRKELDAWEKEQQDAFEHLPGQAKNWDDEYDGHAKDDEYRAERFRTHFGRHP